MIMNNMTWKELAEHIQSMPEDSQLDNVTVYIRDVDEFFPIPEMRTAIAENGVLDKGHEYMIV